MTQVTRQDIRRRIHAARNAMQSGNATEDQVVLHVLEAHYQALRRPLRSLLNLWRTFIGPDQHRMDHYHRYFQQLEAELKTQSEGEDETN